MALILYVLGTLGIISGVVITMVELSETGVIMGFGLIGIGSGISVIWMGLILDELRGIKTAILSGGVSTPQVQVKHPSHSQQLVSSSKPEILKSKTNLYCPSCRYEVKPLAAKCPNCGHRIQ